MDRKDLANILNEMALYLELDSQNPFKIKAYLNASRALLKSGLTENQLKDEQKLVGIKGIGKSVAASIVQAALNGTIDELEELKNKVPPGLVEMTKIPGLGPKKVLALSVQLGIKNVGELAYACNENRLVELKGFGQKTQQKILDGIEFLKKNMDRFLFPEAAAVVSDLSEYLITKTEVIETLPTGELRRLNDVISKTSVLIISNAPKQTFAGISSWIKGAPFKILDDNHAALKHPAGPEINITIAPPENKAPALIIDTGSDSHLEELNKIAEEKDFRLTDQHFYRAGTVEPVKTETQIYEALDLDFIPPELREGFNEITLAEKHQLPRLVKHSEIKGLFHIHTNWSDGGNSLKEMAEAAIELGYEYIGITDHSKTAFYAGGLTGQKLIEQKGLIAELNQKLSPFRIFHGIESDILPDGSLDYSDEILAELDFVIASIHSNFNLDEESQTKRIIKAINHPATTILGHPTGRLLLARPPYKFNLEQVIETCEKNGTVLEINSHPVRLDTDWRVIRENKDKNLKYAICPDAHSKKGLIDTLFGVNIARKGGLSPDDIINCLSANEIDELLKSRKKKI